MKPSYEINSQTGQPYRLASGLACTCAEYMAATKATSTPKPKATASKGPDELETRIRALPASLQGYARQLRAQGWDAVDALKAVVAEGIAEGAAKERAAASIEGLTADDITALLAAGLTREEIKANSPRGIGAN